MSQVPVCPRTVVQVQGLDGMKAGPFTFTYRQAYVPVHTVQASAAIQRLCNNAAYVDTLATVSCWHSDALDAQLGAAVHTGQLLPLRRPHSR
eukprot:scaffold165063_cov20-Tisochrysis_lutea.AAC.1